MKILMTGATGFIGAHTARRFREAGYDLRLLVRKSSKLDLLQGLDYETAYGDVTDQASVEAALDGVEGLVDMAGVTSFLPKDRELVHRINVDGTRIVLEAALARGVAKVLHTSSVAAVGAVDEPSQTLDEDSAWDVGDKANFYIRSKHEGEEAAWAVAKKGLDLVCVNPGIVLGPGDHYGSSTVFLLNYIKGKFPGYIAGGSSNVDVRDVAEGHVRAFEKGKPGRRYILSGENLTNTALITKLVELSGMKRLKKIPYPIAMAVASLNAWIIQPLTGAANDFNPSTVRVGAMHWFVDNKRSIDELGMTYRSMDESIRDTLSWAIAHGHLRPNTPQLTALAPAA